jgi:hypothetical protein
MGQQLQLMKPAAKLPQASLGMAIKIQPDRHF